MVIAYDAAGRDNDANLTWDLAKSLAPPDVHRRLEAERDQAVVKRDSAATDGASPKAKKSTSSNKPK
jgi:hypothetical protein